MAGDVKNAIESFSLQLAIPYICYMVCPTNFVCDDTQLVKVLSLNSGFVIHL